MQAASSPSAETPSFQAVMSAFSLDRAVESKVADLMCFGVELGAEHNRTAVARDYRVCTPAVRVPLLIGGAATDAVHIDHAPPVDDEAGVLEIVVLWR